MQFNKYNATSSPKKNLLLWRLGKNKKTAYINLTEFVLTYTRIYFPGGGGQPFFKGWVVMHLCMYTNVQLV